YSIKVERWQRDLAYDHFLANYSSEDWMIVSDVDEMIDFSSAARKQELFKRMSDSPEGFVKFPTKRYWYDYDNEYKLVIGNVMCTKKYLLETGKRLYEVRHDNRRVLLKKWKNLIAFEYSSCYPAEF